MSSLARGTLLALAAPLALGACTRWVALPDGGLSPSATPPAVVRVTGADGQRLVVYHPAVHGDSVTGWTARTQSPGAAPVSVPAAGIRRVERRGFSPVRTLLAVAGTGAAAIVVLTAAIAASVPPS